MAGGSIDGGAFNLHDLFSRACYQIEYYQREYAWSAEDVRTLITDLFGAFEDARRDSRSFRRGHDSPFFLGPFVYAEQGRDLRFLVDGQQRFTTLHLLFLHLRQAARELGQSDVENTLGQVITSFNPKTQRQFRIDIEERKPLLEALYRGQPYEPPPGAMLSIRNLHERSRQIGELVDERLPDERLEPFVTWLLSRVIMVGILAPSRDSGFRIFESMNDRGARLTSVDLLKSFLLSNVGAEEEKLNLRWRHMLAELTDVRGDADAPRAFLHAVLLARYSRVGEDGADAGPDIEAGLNIWVRRNIDLLGLRDSEHYFRFTEELIKLAGHYRTCLRASRGFYPENGLESLYYNEVNGLTRQMALVLAAIQPSDTDTTAREKAALVANFLDRLFVERVLADEPVQAADFDVDIRRLIPLLRAGTTSDDVRATLSHELPDPGFRNILTFGMRGNNKAQVRYLLARLTAYVETGLRRPNTIAEYLGHERAWQIEHIFANHCERHGKMDPATFRTLRARIGVLLLLRQSDNASYNDLPLDVKKQRYARENGLAAVLASDYRKNNPTLKTFIAENGIEGHFRDFGDNAALEKVVEVRGELYRLLCERIWAPTALGFPEKLRAAEPAEETPPFPAPRRPPNTQLARLVRAHVLAPGVEIEGEHRGVRYIAAVADSGGITLPTGDYYPTPDEAGATVRGTSRCPGMSFWHTVIDGNLLSLREVYAKAKDDGTLVRSGRT